MRKITPEEFIDKAEYSSRVQGFYRAKLNTDRRWKVVEWDGLYWHLAGSTFDYMDNEFSEIDEEIITFKS